MAVSNNITACVTLLALICAIPVIASGIWFASAQGAECARLARWPVAILGGLILLAAIAGFVGAYWNRRRLLAFYLFAMASLIALLIALLVFAFAVTRGSGSYPVLGRAYDEYRLDGFSMWLRGYVSDDPGRWERIKACLVVSDTCKKMARQAGFSGCCKPPSVCGFGYVSPTVWSSPASHPAADPDCGVWGNDPSQLCYECESCRAGLLAALRDQWHRANIALVVATVSLVFLYLVGCSAYKNAQAESLFRRYKW
uniref:Tetraspanin n=1 Tax=Leersia perrieri TaxID=77586 RepID=A0A0D9VDU9_9ORYZ